MATDLELKDFLVDVLLDGEDPGEGVYDLLTIAKDVVEAELDLEILKKVDVSNTTTGNETYTTNPISLPDDFLRPLTRTAIFVGEIELDQIPLERRETYKNDSHRFYIDFANNNLYFCGLQASSQVVTINYIKTTADITASGGSNVVWPDKFQKLIPYMASTMELEGIDVDDINLGLAVGQNKTAQRLWKAMQYWDHKLKLSAMGGRAGVRRGKNRIARPNQFQP